jgi:hypothetical protein
MTKTSVPLLAVAALLPLFACGGEGPAPARENVASALSEALSPEGVSLWSNQFGDANGGANLAYAGTVRIGDVNGDHRADLCGRQKSGMWCALSNGSSFSAATLWAPELTDAAGWAALDRAESIQLGDIDGNGRSDLCARAPDGLHCSFGTPYNTFTSLPDAPWGSLFSDGNGWNNAAYASTIRLADVNGDHRADACGRRPEGIWCTLSNGYTFTAPMLWAMTARNGYGPVTSSYALEFGDVNYDGKADACGLRDDGVYCALSTGNGFAVPTLWTDVFDDKAGWSEPEYSSTMRLGDIDGDGAADVCARGPQGVACFLSSGSAFTAAYGSNDLTLPFRNGLALGDVDGDGLVDLCGRGSDGVSCALPAANATPWYQTFMGCEEPTYFRVLPMEVSTYNGGTYSFTVPFPTPWLRLDGGPPNQEPNVYNYERLLQGATTPLGFQYLVKKLSKPPVVGGSTRIEDDHSFFLVPYGRSYDASIPSQFDSVWDVARRPELDGQRDRVARVPVRVALCGLDERQSELRHGRHQHGHLSVRRGPRPGRRPLP